MQISKIAADDQVGSEGAEDVGARAGEDGAEVGVGRDGAAQDASDDAGGDGVEKGGEFVGEEAVKRRWCAEAHPTGVGINERKGEGEAESPALAVGEMARREQIAVGFGQADAGEVAKGGFDGDVGKMVDDGAAIEGDARDVDDGDGEAAAEAAEEGGFAGA